jgi:hypothetical protein
LGRKPGQATEKTSDDSAKGPRKSRATKVTEEA